MQAVSQLSERLGISVGGQQGVAQVPPAPRPATRVGDWLPLWLFSEAAQPLPTGNLQPHLAL